MMSLFPIGSASEASPGTGGGRRASGGQARRRLHRGSLHLEALLDHEHQPRHQARKMHTSHNFAGSMAKLTVQHVFVMLHMH